MSKHSALPWSRHEMTPNIPADIKTANGGIFDFASISIGSRDKIVCDLRMRKNFREGHITGYSVPGTLDELEDNADLILRAVNNHDKLITILREAKEEIRLAHDKDVAVYDPTILCRIDVALEEATK